MMMKMNHISRIMERSINIGNSSQKFTLKLNMTFSKRPYKALQGLTKVIFDVKGTKPLFL